MQNYSNHRRFVPLYHYVLSVLLLVILAGAVMNIVHVLGACHAGGCSAPGNCSAVGC